MTEASVAGWTTRPVARFVGIGLLLMAIFTMSWTLWSRTGLPLGVGVVAVAALGSLSILYLVQGIQLIRSAAAFPAARPEELAGRGRAIQVGFGITFGTEGLMIGIVSGLLAANGATSYLQPAIALIVGLHFIPFGFLFRRIVNFYVAGWVVAWAAAGLWLISSQTTPAAVAGALVSLATACGTATYGIYLLRVKNVMITKLKGGTRPPMVSRP